jgi:hypothetical protein
MNNRPASNFVSANSPETNQRQAGDVSPVSLPRRGRDRDNRQALRQPIIRPGQRKPYVKATRQQIDERIGFVARLLRRMAAVRPLHFAAYSPVCVEA